MGRAAVELNLPARRNLFQEALLRTPTDVDAMCGLAASTNARTASNTPVALLHATRFPYADRHRRHAEVCRRGVICLDVACRGLPDDVRPLEEALPRIATLLHHPSARRLWSPGVPVGNRRPTRPSCIDLAIARSPTRSPQAARRDRGTRGKRSHRRHGISAKRLINQATVTRRSCGRAAGHSRAGSVNEWARTFIAWPSRRLRMHRGPGAASCRQRAVHVSCPKTGFLDRYLLAILAFFAAWVIFRSPLTALARQLQASALSGDAPRISAAVLHRQRYRDDGCSTVKSGEGRLRVYLEHGDPCAKRLARRAARRGDLLCVGQGPSTVPRRKRSSARSRIPSRSSHPGRPAAVRWALPRRASANQDGAARNQFQ